MLYAFRWKQEAWVKLGWGKDPIQRASDGWWESSHPTIEKVRRTWVVRQTRPAALRTHRPLGV